MKKETLYTYLGTNGTLTTPIHLEGIYSIKKIRLTADEGKSLTRDGKTFFPAVAVDEKDVKLWREVKGHNN